AATHLPLRCWRVAPVPAQARMRDHHAAAPRSSGFAAKLGEEFDAHLLGAAPEPGVARETTRIAVAVAQRYRTLPVKVRELRRGRVELQAVAVGQCLRPLGLRRTQHRELVGSQGERATIDPAR